MYFLYGKSVETEIKGSRKKQKKNIYIIDRIYLEERIRIFDVRLVNVNYI